VNNIFQFVKNSLSKRFRPIFDLFKDWTHLKYDKKVYNVIVEQK
jgi:hypothetical protein